MSAQPFDLIADLCTAVEQIKREPRPQPDMVPWDEYVTRVPSANRAQCTGGTGNAARDELTLR